eukprot:TRINITY_DN1361_c0_g1_i1.p1 TRINITY_DN1361_c0_g1~~TRINITY_DN1361_c0_g1_i1.p1  ORF type:complete len:307 (-),score=115.21 TRINITY_DN1361_c0_g1_i1:234-1154(-)
MTSAEMDYYAVMDLTPTATQAEIRMRYKELVLKLHPDNPENKNQSMQADLSSAFSKLAEANTILSNEVTRALYDMSKNYKKDNAKERAELNHKHRLEVEKFSSVLEERAVIMREYANKSNGLVILEARYGNLSGQMGEYIDVTAAVQCLATNDQLLIHGGKSKQWLDGFYDPNPSSPNELEVIYRMKSSLHHVIVSDDQELWLPRIEHRVTDTSITFKTMADRRKEAERTREKEQQVVQQKQRRRLWLFGSLAAVGCSTLAWVFRAQLGSWFSSSFGLSSSSSTTSASSSSSAPAPSSSSSASPKS